MKLKLDPIKNLTELAEAIRNIDDSDTSEAGFDMSSPYFDCYSEHPCGTAACIGGWLHLANVPPDEEEEFEDILTEIHPGVAEYEFTSLCYHYPRYPTTPNRLQAARAIEILRDTGKCDWDRAMREGTEHFQEMIT